MRTRESCELKADLLLNFFQVFQATQGIERRRGAVRMFLSMFSPRRRSAALFPPTGRLRVSFLICASCALTTSTSSSLLLRFITSGRFVSSGRFARFDFWRGRHLCAPSSQYQTDVLETSTVAAHACHWNYLCVHLRMRSPARGVLCFTRRQELAPVLGAEWVALNCSRFQPVAASCQRSRAPHR